MFRTKVEIDRHVESRLKNINNETERNMRCFSFAKLYFQVGDYEQTLRYISTYLTTKPQSAEGLNLLGKVLEKQSKFEAALEVYRKSLQVDSKQNSVVVKVCELLGKEEVGLDVPRARYYYEQAQMLAPQNPAVFALKERLVSVESNNPNDVAKLLLSELDNRPTDIQLRIRLVRHFLHNNQIKEAYKHVADIEKRSLTIFLTSLSWYETISEVLFRYQRENMNESNFAWEFWILLISVLDKLAALTLDEHINVSRTGPECVSVVFNLDQSLEIATKHLEKCNERTLVQEFLNHYRAQLCLHFATLLFKQAKRDLIKYKDAMNMALPLLFIAYHTEPADLQSLWLDHTKEEYKQQVDRWHKEAAFRCSQSGHILTAIAKESKRMIIERATQNSSGLWREKLFKTLFVTRDQQSKINTSYFVSCTSFTDITLNLPYLNDLVKYDEVAQAMYPGSIHNLVWICLNLNFSSFRCTMFNGLPYSTKNLNCCSAESINVLDIEAFLYCTTLTAKKQFEDMKQQVYYNSEKPQVLPLAVSDQVVTSSQCKWFLSAYKVYLKEYSGEMSELRLNLGRGIEVVRCVGNHGLDVKLLIILANTFAERAKSLKKESEIESNEARAELYWKAALPLLEKMQKNQALGVCKNRLFEYKSKEMGHNEIVSYIDDGKLFIATQLMKHKEFEKAVSILNGLKSPYASFHQAQIYKTMANEQTNLNKENVTSEMRSQHIILLSRARDCFYLTLDRLRDPAVGGKHPLNQELGSEIEKIERMLCRIDPDMYGHRNEFNGNSADNTSSDGSMADNVNMYSSTILGNGFSTTSNYENRTPNITKHQWESRESRPSPERLDAQFRQMQASCNSTITQILEQNRMVVETQRTMVEELKNWKGSVNDDLKGIKDSINGLKGVVDELQSFRDMNDSIQQLKKEVAELKKTKPPALTEEELYALEEECGGDYGLAPNLSAYPNNLYPNLPPRMPTAGALPFTHPALYPNLYSNLYYPSLGVPQAGALPFNQDSHLQDLRNLNSLSQNFAQPPPMQINQWDAGLFQSGLNQFSAGRAGQLGLVVPPQTAPTEQYSSPLIVASSAPQLLPASVVNVATSKPAPVNVVITNSDPLPKMSSVQTSQVFSVTIPPQHLQGGTTSKSQPHNYQIPLPPVTSSRLTLTNSPSIVSQPPLIVSTQELLSNISPPKYSAVDTTPSKGVGLGLQIEKSLSQCFNTSGISDVSSIEEPDPCPDFKPIIPLPDEVPVNTGEENETVLLSLRAKLYRFVQQDWKERGVGYLKILNNSTTGKTRLLMRRDQVHKICANHFITRDIVLIPMPNNPKAYSWAAHDFADEEIVIEKFSARFKNEQEAESFRVAFEKAKEIAPEPTPEKPKPESSTLTLGGFNFTGTPTFKPKEQEIPKAVSPKEVKTVGPFASFSFEAKASTNIFSTPEAKSTPKNNKFAFGTTNIFSTPTSSAANPRNENFVFSNVATTTSMFSTPISSSEVKITPKNDKPEGSPAAPEEYEPNVDFKPVIPLPELVEVKTGEENAEVLFESRAKILRYDSDTKQWKERGIGIMKILKEENTVRLLMRREQVLKICCNHRLLKNIQFNKMKNSPNALSWCAQDFSEGVLVSEMFAIKFKTEEILNAFHTAIISAQRSLDDNNYANSKIGDDPKEEEEDNVKRDKKVKSGPVEKVTPDHSKEKLKSKLGSWECKNCYNINNAKSNLCEGCGTQKSVVGKHLTLQDPMISTCNESVFSFVNNAVTITPIKASEKPKSGWGDAFKPKAGSWSCNMCMVMNDADKLYCVACDNPKDDTVPKKDAAGAKGINLETSSGAKFSFGIVDQSQPKAKFGVGSLWGDSFKPKPGSWECSQCLVRNDSEKSHCVSCDHPKDNSVAKQEAPKGISLETVGPKFNFGISTTLKPTTTTPQSSLWDAFKPKAGSWECSQCLVRNDADKLHCVSCENPKDDSVPKKEPKKGINLNTPVKFNFGIAPTTENSSPASWSNDNSMPLHYAITNSGINTSTNIKSPFTHTTMSTFSFNAPQISDKESKPFGFIETPSAKKEEEKFVFGSPQKHDFEFTPRSPRRQSGGAKGEDDSELYPEEEEDQIYFKPVIPLPDKIDVKTGEESEEVLYCHRARLYRFVDGDWKERGTGDIKILLSAQSGKLRVVMRRDQVLKICLNHYLTPSVEYLIKDEKSWLFSVMDYSEGEYNHWQFCLRFKTAEIAQEFKKAIDNALNRISNQEATAPLQVEGKDDNSDVEFVSETQVTPEEEQEALKLQLPPKFMSYRQLPDCTCATCQEDDKILQELFKPPSKQPSGIFDTTSCLFGTPCKPSAIDSGDIKSKFIFGKPFSSFSQSSSTPVKPPADSLLKDMLVKPSLLETFNKTPESTASTITTTPTIASNKFTFISETKTPTTNLFSLPTATSTTSGIFSQTPTANIFSQTPTSNLFSQLPTSENIFQQKSTTPSGNLFGSGNTLFGKTADTPKTGNLFTNITANIFGTTAASTPSITGNLFTSATPTSATQQSSIFGGNSTPTPKVEVKPLFGNTAPTFEASASLASLAAKYKSEPEAAQPEIVFKCDSDVTFASLAAATPEKPAFGKVADDVKPFSFLGAGAPVFASSKAVQKLQKDKQEDEEEGGEVVTGAEEYDPHYEPIVPLPDAIVVTTGEEDEVPIFNERAKLYRYDIDNKEWKERGVGQLKILHHPVRGTYRLILRREQVHKVVLNMLINPTLDLQPMSTSDKAWLWGGYNYSDDEASLEKLAARFKNCELAQQFYAQVQVAIAAVKEQQNTDVPATVVECVNRVGGETHEEDDGEDEDEGDEDDYEDDRSILFMKGCTLSEQLNHGWNDVGTGDIQIYYDPELYGCRIAVNDQDGQLYSNTLIAVNTEMTLQGNECIWKAIEWAQNVPDWRVLKATFEDVESAQEFHVNYLESVHYATEADIVDGVVAEQYEDEDN